ncbi:hypothetical protein DFH08DRAFT_721774, partial [Mycena albidolilacea]
AGIFFGSSSPRNFSFVVPGPEFGTADRARIFAVHNTFVNVGADSHSGDFDTSKAIIHQICYAAARNVALRWSGQNSDIFKDTVKLLSARHTQTTFIPCRIDGKK